MLGLKAYMKPLALDSVLHVNEIHKNFMCITFFIKIIQDGLSVVVLGPAFESFKIIVRHCHLGHP